ncbi:hypothetical protein BD309DRAFT_950550, partial [Dichomitus squalens]
MGHPEPVLSGESSLRDALQEVEKEEGAQTPEHAMTHFRPNTHTVAEEPQDPSDQAMSLPQNPIVQPMLEVNTGVVPTHTQLSYEILPAIDYPPSQNSTADSPEIRFVTHDGGELPLPWALDSRGDRLVDARISAPLPEDVAAKLNLRLHYPGCSEAYTRQIMSRRSTAAGEPISMKELAKKIAREMGAYITRERNRGCPMMFKGRPVELDDLLLWRLRRVSSGSWTADFKIARFDFPLTM